jgi:hypothetical protein
MTPAALGAVYLSKIFLPFLTPLWSLPSLEYLENTLSIMSSSSAPLKSETLDPSAILIAWTLLD